uniref:Ubiquitin associated protein 1 like n=1 Tax=Strix occidentalis caurina TaxID=311401 RepID=A0A8D0EQ58_STROC
MLGEIGANMGRMQPSGCPHEACGLLCATWPGFRCPHQLLLALPQHDFSLERKVLYWVEVASQQQTAQHRVTSEVVPTAPPCWLLLVDSADSYGGRPRRNTGRGLALHPNFYQARPKTSPGLLEPLPDNGSCNPASPDLRKQRRSMVIFNNMKNELEAARRKLASLVHPSNTAAVMRRGVPVSRLLPPRRRTSRSVKYGPAPDVSQLGTLVPAPPATAAPIPPIKRHKPTVPSLSPYACLPPTSTPAQPLSSHRSQSDWAADLLSALSQEERDLIEPVIALGYPPHKAILTLQKTGRQSLSQFLSYLGACDRLLKQGYEEGQVEEAMEMFQYSEKKAAEFLHLLAQFNDMGFQQNEIKEVLLLCGNQREKALEELVMKTQ